MEIRPPVIPKGVTLPFARMKVGDSFIDPNRTASALCTAFGLWQWLRPGTTYGARKVDGGVLVWRAT